MALIPEYKTLSEKASYFYNGETAININIDGIFQRLKEFENQDVFVFRGCTEAKYKLFSSAQRYYINREFFHHATNGIDAHYHDFIHNLIEECKDWNDGTIKNLLIHSGIDEHNSIAYLSYMQHFGIPTPFIDFTTDPYIALFFAIDADFHPSSHEIDNFFSIYYTDKKSGQVEAMKETSKHFLPNLSKGNAPYSDVQKLSMHLMSPEEEAYRLLNNTNIINQKGLFYYNNNPLRPIEAVFLDEAAKIKDLIGEQRFRELLIHDRFVGCFNIHKSLIPFLKKVLNDRGITKEYLFPDNSIMKNAVIDKATINVLRIKKQF